MIVLENRLVEAFNQVEDGGVSQASSLKYAKLATAMVAEEAAKIPEAYTGDSVFKRIAWQIRGMGGILNTERRVRMKNKKRNYKKAGDRFGPWVQLKAHRNQFGMVQDWSGKGPYGVRLGGVGPIEHYSGGELILVTESRYDKWAAR